jgi:hypothetical protein
MFWTFAHLHMDQSVIKSDALMRLAGGLIS